MSPQTATETPEALATRSQPSDGTPDGMTLKEAWGHFYDHSGRASDVSRQLAFAAIAIVWVFSGPDRSLLAIPDLLLRAGLYGAIALGADLLQYIAAALCWYVFASLKEREGVRTVDRFRAPSLLNLPALLFFVVKVLGVGASYTLIARFLLRSLAAPAAT